MNPFRRMEILACDLTQNFTPSQEKEHSDTAAEAVAELLSADPAQDKKELFLTLVTQALCAMTLYVEDLQAAEGAKILQQVAEGKEPPPNFHHLVHPRSNVWERWKSFCETVQGPEAKFATGTPLGRQIFYAGAAAMYGLIADKAPELGTPAGGLFMEDLEIELSNFAAALRDPHAHI